MSYARGASYRGVRFGWAETVLIGSPLGPHGQHTKRTEVGHAAGQLLWSYLAASFWRLPVRVAADPAGEPLVRRRVRWHGELFAEDLPAIGGGRGSSTGPLRVITVAYAHV